MLITNMTENAKTATNAPNGSSIMAFHCNQAAGRRNNCSVRDDGAIAVVPVTIMRPPNTAEFSEPRALVQRQPASWCANTHRPFAAHNGIVQIMEVKGQTPFKQNNNHGDGDHGTKQWPNIGHQIITPRTGPIMILASSIKTMAGNRKRYASHESQHQLPKQGQPLQRG